MVVAWFGEMGGIAVGHCVPEGVRLLKVSGETDCSLGYVHLVQRDWVRRTSSSSIIWARFVGVGGCKQRCC